MDILLNPIVMTMAAIIAAVIVLVILVKSCWRVAGTNEVLIVSGLGKVKTKTGTFNVGAS